MKLSQHVSHDQVNLQREEYGMEDEILIEVVRKRVVLYDIRVLDYRNSDKKKKEWMSVSEEVGRPGNYFCIIYLSFTVLDIIKNDRMRMPLKLVYTYAGVDVVRTPTTPTACTLVRR